ncbi:hypothetical protein BJD55_gp008 [Gordonia phage Yvonnetastic]|uniref:Uncharacterized protein n=1 Tax=Gordonia phage Yvonnetastic TaxID=1821566 RepID=A0A142K8X4_9CAUD|nr:hypothetical protein BJD55_gp008 [Gordonia phage Yvonnetastic]AMS02557.1 hypothetical protein SEA_YVONNETASTIC_8 [Gordonia phage Yvonnetastic]WKW85988.1 hypothetical protein SEA_JONJAMES_7 [Gordonia Phage JonJames]
MAHIDIRFEFNDKDEWGDRIYDLIALQRIGGTVPEDYLDELTEVHGDKDRFHLIAWDLLKAFETDELVVIE